MRVLFLCMRMVFEVNERNKKHTTGYSYMVRDIAEYAVKEGVSVDVLAISDEKHIKQYKGARVISRSLGNLLLNLRPYYLFKALKTIRKYKPSLKMALRVLYYYFYNGYVEKCIKKGNYDLIHVHGLGYGGLAYADCCERLGVKYILTFHALASFSEEMRKPKGIKQLERDYLKHVKTMRIPVTAISTGMMGKIMNFLDIDDNEPYFYKIQNGTKVNTEYLSDINIRTQYGIRDSQKIVLCVGNICRGKNQIQIVRAVKHLSEEVRDKVCIMFLGRNIEDTKLNIEISRLGLNDNFRICGNIPKDVIGNYYAQADYTIMASISEGFGLSIIEGFSYGLPNLSFVDLEAVPDLFDQNAMVTIESRTDEALADGICQLLENKWDRGFIKRYAKRFSLERMAAQYVSVYSKLI